MAIFKDCSVVVELKNVPYKEKKKLITAITDNGGNILYIVNQKCSFVVATSLETLSRSKQRNTQKHQTPVVSQEYVWRCLEKGLLLPIEQHVLKQQTAPHPAGLFGDLPQVHHSGKNRGKTATQVEDGNKFRSYKENDSAIPEFPSHFQVAKYSIFDKDQPKIWSVLELQSAKGQAGQQYRIVRSNMPEAEKTVIKDKEMHSSRSEDAIEVYLMLSKELQAKGFKQAQTLPSWAEALTSHGLQQLLLEEKLNCSTLSQEVGVFVELTWTEAIGSLNNILVVPVTSLSLNDVSRVEGLLLQARKTESDDEVKALLEQVNSLLPLRMAEPESKNKLVSQKLDLCQLIRDILNMTEATLGNSSPSSLGKYRALRCSIEQVPSQSPEFQHVSQLLHDGPVQIQQILRVSRGAELHMFREELGNVKSLLHSTAPSSFVGILSRGLLLPRVGVKEHGIQRTDVGNLGAGIYFSDSINTSLKYSKPTETDGSRLLLVCEVALGQCKDLHRRDFTLTCAPEGYDSVHGVRRTKNITSHFEDDEYVVYSTDQVRLKYVIQYILDEDQVKDFQPVVNNTLGIIRFGTISDALTSDDAGDLNLIKNPLEDITAGLLNSSGQTLPLQAVHVRCKLMDLLCQVIIFQTYTNQSDNPIEAKYVFPLEDSATVCGFEAFINGKHVIGKVKEKEQARKEYKQAIEKGHGAYLMDQDAPDVFTISVGNLPPGATVLIKVTFLMELVVRGGTIVFSLPGSVAPWQQSAALNQTTQTTVEKIYVNVLQPEGEFSLSMSIEMPYEIIDLDCSHQIKIKRTDCKAVVSTLPDQTLDAEGFRLTFSLSQLHMPRMWVEKHPEKDTEACMLVFYPHFESSDFSSSGLSDVIILLDTSESMRGESMLNARRIALKVLNSLDRSIVRVNIITFGTDYKEAFLSPNLLMETFDQAKNFIMSSAAVGGSTELWRPLRSLNLLPPSYGVRNVLLLSDGHVQNQPQTLQMVRESARHTRLFTCGLSPTANRHMLRALAEAGGGAYEFFDTKTKHTWAEKVSSLVRCMEAPGCSSVSVKWQQFSPIAPRPVQAPSQLCALFNDCHTLVYGFVPHCTQATLFGDLSGQELKTMVSTTELQKTKGTFLHKLTARAIIRDYEDGSLASNEAEHEGKKAELKSYIIELSKEFSILSQFTSFVAIEERDQDQPDTGFTDVPKIVAEEDVDILPYMGWKEQDIPAMDMEADLEIYEEYEQYGTSPIEYSEDDEFDYEPCSISVDTDTHSPEKNDEYFPIAYGAQPLQRNCVFPLPPPLPFPPPGSVRSALPAESFYTTADFAPLSTSGFFSPSSSAGEPLHVQDMSYGAASLIPYQGRPRSYHAEQQSAPLFGRAIKALAPKRAELALSVSAPPPPPPPPGRAAPYIPPVLAAPTDLHLHSVADLNSLCAVPCSSFSVSNSEPQQEAISMHMDTDSNMDMAMELDTAFFDSCSFAFHSPSVSGSKECLPQANLVESYPSTGPGASLVSGASFVAPVPKTAEIICYRRPQPTSFGAAKSRSAFFVPSVSGPEPPASPPSPTSDILSAAEESAPRDDTDLLCSYRSMRPVPLSLKLRKRESSRAFSRARVGRRECNSLETGISLGPYRQHEEINWGELFDLQHQDGYWECTGRLSRFLGLDVDYFANVFLKEKGICSLGAKAHTDILRLVATMLVLQLIRVQMAVGELFQSLLRLNDKLEHKPAHWDAVKKAVDWACWADRQYPCVCSRLELGWDWESCTRQLLRLDSAPAFSPLMPFLQRNTGLEVM